MKLWARHVSLAILVIGLGWSITPLILYVGGPWAWVLLWLLSIVACPLVVSLLARKFELVYGPLINVVSTVSLAYYSYRSAPKGSNSAGPGVVLALGAIAILFGLAVSGAVRSWRQE